MNTNKPITPEFLQSLVTDKSGVNGWQPVTITAVERRWLQCRYSFCTMESPRGRPPKKYFLNSTCHTRRWW